MFKLVTVALLAAFPNPFGGLHIMHRGDVQTTRYGVQGWRLDVRNDRFSGQTSCTVRKGDVTVRHGVAVFQFRRSVDTANAQFRIDQGPAQSVGSVVVEAAGLGASVAGGDLRNPSGGRVAIPLRLVSDAHQVSIRPNARGGRREFNLSGLAAAQDAARTQGCDVVLPPPPLL